MSPLPYDPLAGIPMEVWEAVEEYLYPRAERGADIYSWFRVWNIKRAGYYECSWCGRETIATEKGSGLCRGCVTEWAP